MYVHVTAYISVSSNVMHDREISKLVTNNYCEFVDNVARFSFSYGVG